MYGAGGGGMVVVVLASWVLYKQNGVLHERLSALSVELEVSRATNVANVSTIDELVLKNNMCVDDRRVDAERAADTVRLLRADLDELRLRPPVIQREEIYRDPSCAELGAIDIARACPALAGGLRKRAQSIDSN